MDGNLKKDDAELVADAQDAARVLKAIGNPARLRILQELAKTPRQVSDLEATLGLGQAYVSQQLARLRGEGIVSGDRSGRTVLYRIVDARIEPVLDVLPETCLIEYGQHGARNLQACDISRILARRPPKH